jgi:putative protease
VELLAPVGSKDTLKAAILGGADAVYLAGRHFGARRLAENFSDSNLKAAVNLSHKHGVKVYVTMNTLIKEWEFKRASSHLSFLESINIDAVIVQDRGLLRLIRENFSLPIFASTQMGIHSPEGAMWAEKNGVRRIILARELHLAELEKLKQVTQVELEVFIHGAQCYAFSGQCLFSSILGGRSGNRGVCAQPCRKLYIQGREKGYLLSTADIFGVSIIPELLKMGIDGLKIEGRMRSPNYVYLTSKIYSNAIRRAEDGVEILITPKEKEMLEVVFNRGFNKGYLIKKNVIHREYPGSRGLLLGTAIYTGKNILIKTEQLRIGDGVTLYRNNEKIGGFSLQQINKKNGICFLRNPPFRIRKGEYQLYKTKDHQFAIIQKLINKLKFTSTTYKKKVSPFHFIPKKRSRTSGKLSFYITSLKTLDAVMPYADRIYFELNNDFHDAQVICRKAGIDFVLIMPRLTFNVPNVDVDHLMICSLGQFEKYSHRKLFGYYSMNFFNSLTIPHLYQYTLSVELSKENINNITSHFLGRLEVMVFGKIELMVSRDPSLKEGILIDSKRKNFPTYRDQFGLIHILNSSDLFLLDYLDEFDKVGINSFGIDLRRRDVKLCKIVAKAFYDRDLNKKATIKRKCKSITAGHYLRGVY